MTSSTPRALRPDAPQHSAVETHSLAEQLSSMDELMVAGMNDLRFAHFQVETPEADVVSFSRDRLTKIFLGPQLWQTPDRVAPYLRVLTDPVFTLICVGSRQDLQLVPEYCRRPEIHFIALPTATSAIYESLATMHRFQQLLLETHVDARTAREENERVKYVLSISRQLAGERNIPKLLSLILSKAREVTGADAGSIYTVESPTSNVRDGKILFHITQNDSIVLNLSHFSMDVTETSMVGNAVIHGVPINIPDLYCLDDSSTKTSAR